MHRHFTVFISLALTFFLTLQFSNYIKKVYVFLYKAIYVFPLRFSFQFLCNLRFQSTFAFFSKRLGLIPNLSLLFTLFHSFHLLPSLFFSPLFITCMLFSYFFFHRFHSFAFSSNSHIEQVRVRNLLPVQKNLLY